MRLLAWSVCSVGATLLGIGLTSALQAQTPSVLYTWDQSFGESVGPDVEMWGQGFGDNALTFDNNVDGSLTITETGTPGLNWAANDSFNRIKESLNPLDYGGLDLTGLTSLEIDLGHNGANTVSGQVFAQTGPGGGSFQVLGGIDVVPGPVQTYSVPLTGMPANAIGAMATIGIQIFDHEADGNLTWTLNEIRSLGTPQLTRRIADYPVGGPAGAPAAPSEGAIFNFDADGFVSGHTAGQNNSGMGFNSVDGALTWTEVPVDGNAPGAAVTWGSGDGVGLYPPTEYFARPVDLSNYSFAKVRLRVQSTVPGEDVSVQFYTQGAGFAYHTAGPDQVIPADAQYHELVFPLAGIGDLDQTQFHGINLGAHAGTWAVRIDYVEYTSIPEPASVALVGLVAVVGIGLSRRRNG